MPSGVHIAAKNSTMNCVRLSLGAFLDMPKVVTDCSKNNVTIVVAVVFAHGIFLVTFENRSVNTIMN